MTSVLASFLHFYSDFFAFMEVGGAAKKEKEASKEVENEKRGGINRPAEIVFSEHHSQKQEKEGVSRGSRSP